MTKAQTLRVRLDVLASLGNDFEENIINALIEILDIVEGKDTIGFKNEKEK